MYLCAQYTTWEAFGVLDVRLISDGPDKTTTSCLESLPHFRVSYRVTTLAKREPLVDSWEEYFVDMKMLVVSKCEAAWTTLNSLRSLPQVMSSSYPTEKEAQKCCVHPPLWSPPSELVQHESNNKPWRESFLSHCSCWSEQFSIYEEALKWLLPKNFSVETLPSHHCGLNQNGQLRVSECLENKFAILGDRIFWK